MDRKSNCVSGGDNNLAVVVQSSDNANVQCTGDQAPSYLVCHIVVRTMLASVKRQTFGSIGILPLTTIFLTTSRLVSQDLEPVIQN